MSSEFNYAGQELYMHRIVSKHPEGCPVHIHEEIELFYFIQGNCTYMVEGNEYDLQPGDVLLMRPSESHKLCVLSDVPFERIVISLPLDLLKRFDPDGKLLPPVFDRPLGRLNRYRKQDFDTPLYEQCFESLSVNSPLGVELDSMPKILTILSEIYKVFTASAEVPVQENDKIAVKIISYVNMHIFENISLNEISEKFFISQSQLSRIFRQATGTSVWEYILIKRLIAARDRIRSGMPAGTVCNYCGFKDYSCFYRQYRARFGVSPKQDAPCGKN